MTVSRGALRTVVIWLLASQGASAQSVEDFLPDYVPSGTVSFERPLVSYEPGFETAQSQQQAGLSVEIAGARVSPDFKRRGLRVDIPMELAFGTAPGERDGDPDEDGN